MYVVQHSEASVHAIGSAGTKIAIVRVPSGKVVQLINIKEEGKRHIPIIHVRERGGTLNTLKTMCEPDPKSQNDRAKGIFCPWVTAQTYYIYLFILYYYNVI